MKKTVALLLNVFMIVSLLIPASSVQAMASGIGHLFGPSAVTSGLYRSTLVMGQAYDWTRLEKTGVKILKHEDELAVVLATATQLEQIAKAGFQMQASEELGSLVAENAGTSAWLAKSLAPQLAQAQRLTVEAATENATGGLEVIVAGMTAEQQSGILAFPGVDNDADGLTDTQETWWCTDPNNPDSDGDGTTDGMEVNLAKQWLSNHGSGVPSSGKPFSGWPDNHPGCYDDDMDSVPDMAERWELGLNMNRESTDGDKFDDGQELFGITKYPGYGGLPRSEDTFITSSMPGWVDPPGNSPVVAAYPQISIDIVPNSLQVRLVTTVTTGESHSTGQVFGYSTTNSEGTSTGVGKEESHTFSEWQEVSNSVADSIERSTYRSVFESDSQQSTTEHSIGSGVATENGWQTSTMENTSRSFGAQVSTDLGAIATKIKEGGFGASFNSEEVNESGFQSDTSWAKTKSTTEQTTTSETSGHEAGWEEGSSVSFGVVHESSQSIGVGKETTQAATFTTETYQEFSVTNDHQIATGQEWSSATAVDSSRAALLTFTYTVHNGGTDNARQISQILLNVYIEGVKSPITTYAGVLTGESCTQVSVQNLYPGDRFPALGTATQCGLALNLDQLARIDQGAAMRVVVADYNYGDDEQFYENAWGQGVIVEVDDDTWDGDERLDRYLIPTWGIETYQQVLKRYFQLSETEGGDLLSVQMPEYTSTHEINEWNDYPITDRSWWNMYLSDYGEGPNIRFREKIAVAESRILMRFNKDTDKDQYSDRVERKYHTDLTDPEDHPNAELVAGYYEVRQGNEVQVQLALENFGDFDAIGTEATMIAVDDSVTVGIPLVGIGGLVRAGEKVLLSSRILQPEYPVWSGTSRSKSEGRYSGLTDNTFTFIAPQSGQIGVTAGLRLNWTDSTGASGFIAVGSGYTAPTRLTVAQGLEVGMNSGTLTAGDRFTITALGPRDVFTYTINREPYTPPIMIVSYNDPRGNKRFSTTAKLNQITDRLEPFRQSMAQAPELILESENGFSITGENQVIFTLTNPTDDVIEDGSLVVLYGESKTATVTASRTITTDFLPGPNLFIDTWNTSEFIPGFDPNKAYKVKVFAVDRQGWVIDVAFSQFSALGASRPAECSLSTGTWDFGSVFRGELVTSELAYANTGYSPLWVWAGQGAPLGMRPAATVYQLQPGEMRTLQLSLDTTTLPAGVYSGTLPLRTNDPNHPTLNIQVSGTILAPSNGVAPQADAYHPLTETIRIAGPQAANTILTYPHDSDIPGASEPVVVLDEAGVVMGGGAPFSDVQSVQPAQPEMPLEAGPRQSEPTRQAVDELAAFELDVTGAKELVQYRSASTRVFVWPDGRGVAVAGLPETDAKIIRPNDMVSDGVTWDAYVNAQYPDVWQTGQVRTYIGNAPSDYKQNARSLIRFNLPGLPAYSIIDLATFHLNEYSWVGSNTIDTQVYRITSYWDESSQPTWNNQPGIDWGTVWSTLSVPKSAGWRDWTITELARSWYSGTPNYGLMLRANPENANGVVFYSRENGTLTPHIKVYFHIAPPPTAPTLSAISNSDGDGAYTVDWSDTANTTGYDLQEKLNSGDWNLIYSTASSVYSAAGRAAGQWCYQVRAVNTTGASDWSASQCAVVNPPPGAPTLYEVSNSDGDGSFTVDWNDMTYATGYELQEAAGPTGTYSTIYSNATSNFSVTGKGTGQWCYRVRANNPSGTSGWSTVQCAQVNMAPNKPTGLLPTAGTLQLGRLVTLSWQDGGDPDQYPSTPRQYRVEVWPVAGGSTLSSGWITTQNWQAALPADGMYQWRVEASDTVSTSGWTANQGLGVYSIERSSSSQVRLALPQAISAPVSYQVRYGLRAGFQTGNNPQTVSIQLPKRLYSTVTLDLLTHSAPAGAVEFSLDMAADGTVEWTRNFNWSSPVVYQSPNLSAAVNQVMAQSQAAGGELVIIPVRVNFNVPGELVLMNLAAAVQVDSDPLLGSGDLRINTPSPMETDRVTVTARVHNNGVYTSRHVMVSFYLGNPASGGRYLGSQLIPAIPANGYAEPSLEWDTSGTIGPVDLFAVVDGAGQIPEQNEQNNVTSLAVTLRTRPDLETSSLTSSDNEPVVGQALVLSLTESNLGQTDVPASRVTVYDGDPQDGGLLIGESEIGVIAGSSTGVDFTWVPGRAGWHRLYAFGDQAGQVAESNEANNHQWRDIYVGFAGPILMDSGAATDSVYSTETGYGYVDMGQADQMVACAAGSNPENTMRRDPTGAIYYRFDHLQPGHYYHLDLILNECDEAGRQESILVDDIQIGDAQDLGDGETHRLSLRLDPALYADRTITVAVRADGIDGAVVSAVNLHDIDYRYADAGGSKDPQYPGSQGYGWLDGTSIVTWGTLPYRSVRVDQGDNTLRYQFDDLKSNKRYNVHFTLWQPSGTARIQKVQVDGVDSGLTVNTGDTLQHHEQIAVPLSAYTTDGQITISIVRTNASTGAMVNEVALEEETVRNDGACEAQETPYFSETYGSVLITQLNAPVGSVIQGVNPRGETVGCFTVTSVGNYGFMRIYGEDTSAVPAVPGMRAGEMVAFRVNGAPAVASPLFYWSDDHAAHPVNLNAGNITGQAILLQSGWNLVSFQVEPPTPLVASTLQSINARYDRVLGEYGIYATTLPDAFNTLRELHSGVGYYIRVTSSTSVSLLVDGITQPCGAPKQLHSGWNWIGAPCAVTATEAALNSIAGHYQRVLSLTKTYDPALPLYNTLTQLRPGEGYLIYSIDPVTLTYPESAPMPAAPDVISGITCRPVSATPSMTIVYGEARVGDHLAPSGMIVEVLTPRGEVAGCGIISEGGRIPLIQVYGADEHATAGFQPGEAMFLRINGISLTDPLDIPWQDDKSPHFVQSTVEPLRIYLPALRR
jgi:hypothetical protein